MWELPWRLWLRLSVAIVIIYYSYIIHTPILEYDI
jgi:hypothetical protein